jgi:acyl-CoA synthetase (AMP-forming)/AMP-acid ligase II
VSGQANIGFDLRALAAARPDAPALIAPDVTLSLSKLWRLVDCFACRMTEAGIGQDARVGLATGDRIVAVAGLFAAALVGAEFTTVDHFLLRVPALRPTHFLRSPETPGLEGVPFQLMDARWSPKLGSGSADGGAGWSGYAGEDAPAWIVQSSGTTGQPKFMRLSAALLRRRVQAVMTEFDPAGSRTASLFMPGSRPFLIRAAAAVLAGAAIVDSHDIGFLQAQGVDIVSAAPRLVRDWLGGRRIEPKLARLQCSGAKLGAKDLEQFLASFDQVEDVYGSSETIKAHVNVSRLENGRIVTRGEPAAGSLIEILRADGSPCAEGEVGALRIRNDCLAEGYFDDAEATARSFRDGWFHPGDLAAWGPNGRLDIQGRASDVLNLGGLKVSLSEMDQILSSVPGVVRGVVFRHPMPGLTDALAAVVELEAMAPPDATVANAHAACEQARGPFAAPRDILVVASVPMTGDGMPRRGECQDMFLRAAMSVAPASP